MAEQLTWAVSVRVAGGPSKLISQMLAIDACDMIAVSVPYGGVGTDVQVHPSSQVEFLMITTDQAGDGLTYKSPGGMLVHLDQKA